MSTWGERSGKEEDLKHQAEFIMRGILKSKIKRARRTRRESDSEGPDDKMEGHETNYEIVDLDDREARGKSRKNCTEFSDKIIKCLQLDVCIVVAAVVNQIHHSFSIVVREQVARSVP